MDGRMDVRKEFKDGWIEEWGEREREREGQWWWMDTARISLSAGGQDAWDVGPFCM